MTLFYAANTAMPTTAAPTPVTTGTAIKTMLQIAPPATRPFKIVRWGFSFSSAPTAIVTCELVETGTVFGTVTAHVAAGVQPYGSGGGVPVSTAQLGTALSGYTASAEGSIVASRQLDTYICPIGVSSYQYEWSLGREAEVVEGRCLRVRMTTAVAVSAYTWCVWDE